MIELRHCMLCPVSLEYALSNGGHCYWQCSCNFMTLQNNWFVCWHNQVYLIIRVSYIFMKFIYHTNIA